MRKSYFNLEIDFSKTDRNVYPFKANGLVFEPVSGLVEAGKEEQRDEIILDRIKTAVANRFMINKERAVFSHFINLHGIIQRKKKHVHDA